LLIHHHDNTSTEMIEFSSLWRTLKTPVSKPMDDSVIFSVKS
jgi:hypothetical protein